MALAPSGASRMSLSLVKTNDLGSPHISLKTSFLTAPGDGRIAHHPTIRPIMLLGPVAHDRVTRVISPKTDGQGWIPD